MTLSSSPPPLISSAEGTRSDRRTAALLRCRRQRCDMTLSSSAACSELAIALQPLALDQPPPPLAKRASPAANSQPSAFRPAVLSDSSNSSMNNTLPAEARSGNLKRSSSCLTISTTTGVLPRRRRRAHLGFTNANLLDACRDGTASAVGDIIDAGADVNWIDDHGRTALFIACCDVRRPNWPIVATLLEHGADPMLATSGKSPLCVVCAHDSCRERASLLLNHGADPNDDRYHLGSRPLLLATTNSAEALIHLLLDCGAWINGRDAHGNTPLDIACQLGHVRVVQLLLGHNAHLRTKAGVYKDDVSSVWLPYAMPPGHHVGRTQTQIRHLVDHCFGLGLSERKDKLLPEGVQQPAERVTPRPIHPIAALLRFREFTRWLDLRLSKRRSFLEHLRLAGMKRGHGYEGPASRASHQQACLPYVGVGRHRVQ